MADRDWIRIPLIGDPDGVVLIFPKRQISEENWAHLMLCLDAMRPGLVEPERTAVRAAPTVPDGGTT